MDADVGVIYLRSSVSICGFHFFSKTGFGAWVKSEWRYFCLYLGAWREFSKSVQETIVAQKLLTKCFEPLELDFLNQQARFQQALSAMETLSDFERVSELGHHLLLARDEVPSR